jgi:hypothetical protein
MIIQSLLSLAIIVLLCTLVLRENYWRIEFNKFADNSLKSEGGLNGKVFCERTKFELEAESCKKSLLSIQNNISLLEKANEHIQSDSTTWGQSWESNKTGGHIETFNIRTDCELPNGGIKVCCAAVIPELANDKAIGIGLDRAYRVINNKPLKETCSLTKVILIFFSFLFFYFLFN